MKVEPQDSDGLGDQQKTGSAESLLVTGGNEDISSAQKAPLSPSGKRRWWLYIVILVGLCLVGVLAFLFFGNTEFTGSIRNTTEYAKLDRTGVGSLYLKNDEKYTLSSGDTICVDTSVTYVYGSEDCKRSEGAEGSSSRYISLLSNRKYILDRGGSLVTIDYDSGRCTTKEVHGPEGEAVTVITGCTVNIDIKKRDDSEPLKWSGEMVFGPGMGFYSRNSFNGTESKTSDPDSVKRSAIVSSSPYVELVGGGPYAIWVSDNHCGGAKACSVASGLTKDETGIYGYGESTELQNYNTTIGAVTRKGAGTVTYTPVEIYEKATKTVDLDGATLTVKVLSYWYEDCPYYCRYIQTREDAKIGTVYDRFKFGFYYIED